MADQLAALRADLKAQVSELTVQRCMLEARIGVLINVIDDIDHIEAMHPATAAEPAPPPTGRRAPRRDVQGAVLKAVREGVEARGVRLSITEIGKGAGILLDGEALTESATRRTLNALVLLGQIYERDGLYAPTPDPEKTG